MCTTCGCATNAETVITGLKAGAPLKLAHESNLVHLEQAILSKNDRLAEENRLWLESRGILALNLMSSPGAGKTTLLERTLRELGKEIPFSVIEGDQET